MRGSGLTGHFSVRDGLVQELSLKALMFSSQTGGHVTQKVETARRRVSCTGKTKMRIYGLFSFAINHKKTQF